MSTREPRRPTISQRIDERPDGVRLTPPNFANHENLEVSLSEVRARYEYADAGEPTLGALVDAFLEKALPEVRQP